MKRNPPILAIGLLLVLAGLASPAEQGERTVIVGFKRAPGLTEESLIRNAKGKIHRGHQIIPAMTVTLPEREITKLKRRSEVAYVEANAVYELAAGPSPGAAAPASTELGNSWGVAHIFADVAHAGGNKGTGIKVAILDTGIDYNHEDLAGNYLGGYDFVFRDNDPFDDNFLGHGTHVAGIIAAQENGIGVIGVAPEAKIFAVKVLDGAGFGTADWIVAGIEWAVANGADVISMSFQGPDTQALKDACDKARAAGVLLVAAGGNSLAGGQPLMYPAAYDSVIAVTATDKLDVPGYFAPVDAKLEFAAPGVDVYSTVAGGGYGTISGTSQAAPHVAGAVALYLRSNTRDINNDGLVDSEDVRLLLQATAIELGDPGRDPVFGYGLVNAGLAVSGGGGGGTGGGGGDDCGHGKGHGKHKDPHDDGHGKGHDKHKGPHDKGKDLGKGNERDKGEAKGRNARQASSRSSASRKGKAAPAHPLSISNAPQ